MARVAAAVWAMRRAHRAAAILRGAAMAAIVDHAMEAAWPLRANAGKRGARRRAAA